MKNVFSLGENKYPLKEIKDYINSLKETDEKIKEMRNSNNIISFGDMSLEEKIKIIEQNKGKKALVLTLSMGKEKYTKGIIKPKDNYVFALHSAEEKTHPN